MSNAVHHLCFSGSPACSGCNPCVACADMVNERVLPAATIAAGLHGSLLALVHLFAQQLYRMGVDPANLALSQTGVPLSTVFAKPEDQIRAFLAGYREAWGRLIQSMTQDPTVSARVIRTEVGSSADVMTEEAIQEMLRGRGYAGPSPQTAEASPPPPVAASPASPASPSSPTVEPAPKPAVPVSTASYEAFVKKAKESQPSNTEPMDAEDVAAAALAVDTANGALGPQRAES